ncbi:ABC transporter ATP-binding protein [Sporichthya polymorpha]|uniref:ABC transporter ATP-binding protein n=1 Tax=Sporichthya polymorpha TaxID=35751 RepID=UPI00036E5D04|nr:ABC transporter ATP-binding protein [Sporichthya polymorpha]
MTVPPVLAVSDLAVTFDTARGPARAVDGVSFDVRPGETLAIVGESGSGKSVTSLAVLGLLPERGTTVTGAVRFGDTDLLTASQKQLRAVRGRGVAMVFQDPMTSLNPMLTVGRQLTEGMEVHLNLTGRAAEDRAVELLEAVGIPDARSRLRSHPHELSGGLRQRVMIAIALACDPSVLIADEATTALDVTVQAQILDLVARLQERLGTAVIWISHDLGVVAGIADRVAVMYAGRVVEEASIDDLFSDPRHPYTRALLAARPILGQPRDRLTAIPGRPPDPVNRPPGCAFRPRCPVAADPRCDTEAPPLREVAPNHRAAVFYDLTDLPREGVPHA